MTIFCDFIVVEPFREPAVCGAWEPSAESDTATESRQKNVRYGWTYRAGKDYCPKHSSGCRGTR